MDNKITYHEQNDIDNTLKLREGRLQKKKQKVM